MESLDDGSSVVDCGFEALDFDYEFIDDVLPDNFTVYKPGVPFLHRLKQRLVPNSNFIIDGSIFDNANKWNATAFLDGATSPSASKNVLIVEEDIYRFTVDLCAHMMCPRDNVIKKHVAFHFNPRLPMNCVVRNSYIDDTWGNEEIKTFRRSLLKRGLEFILEIFVSPTEYLIAVNGSHFCAFAHRLPYQEITTVEIDGDITLNKVELMSSKNYPAISNNHLTSKGDLELPLTKKFPRSIAIPTTVVLEGTVYLLPFNCIINLQSGCQVYPHPLIALHMNLRWRPSLGDVIIFNSWTDDKWESEMELPMCNLFQPGASFVLRIEINDNGFQAIINDFPLPIFHHRMKSELVDTLVVQGDVQLTRADVIS